jgi:hypothetical protein
MECALSDGKLAEQFGAALRLKTDRSIV